MKGRMLIMGIENSDANEAAVGTDKCLFISVFDS